jgi:hypothetical protein
MSYILEALRRAEQARKPGGLLWARQSPRPHRESPRRLWPWVIVGAGLLANAAVVWVLLQPAERVPQEPELSPSTLADSRLASRPAPEEAPLPFGAPPRETPTPVAPPRPASEPAPAPLLADRTAPTPSDPSARAAPPAAPPEREYPKGPPAETLAPRVDAAPAPDSAALKYLEAPNGGPRAASAGEPSRAPFPGRIPRLDELSLEARRSLPRLEMSGHVYADDPAQSFVFINGATYRSGERIGGSGPLVREITPEGAVIDSDAGPFRLRTAP